MRSLLTAAFLDVLPFFLRQRGRARRDRSSSRTSSLVRSRVMVPAPSTDHGDAG
jgi:hypothetical protein